MLQTSRCIKSSQHASMQAIPHVEQIRSLLYRPSRPHRRRIPRHGTQGLLHPLRDRATLISTCRTDTLSSVPSFSASSPPHPPSRNAGATRFKGHLLILDQITNLGFPDENCNESGHHIVSKPFHRVACLWYKIALGPPP